MTFWIENNGSQDFWLQIVKSAIKELANFFQAASQKISVLEGKKEKKLNFETIGENCLTPNKFSNRRKTQIDSECCMQLKSERQLGQTNRDLIVFATLLH